MTVRKTQNRKCGRNADGTFATGNSGKAPGTRHKVTRAVERLLDGQAEALTQKAVDMALSGDTTALRLCFERIAPARKDAPVSFRLPRIAIAAEASQAAQVVLHAVSEGELTPLEGTAVMGLVEQCRRSLELGEFEERLQIVEQSL